MLVVDFTLGGRSFSGLNGGSRSKYTAALSMTVACDDQAEVDRLWRRSPRAAVDRPCGWIKDHWGLSWQIVPKAMLEMLGSDNCDGARRAMQAMMQMNKLDLPTLQKAFDED